MEHFDFDMGTYNLHIIKTKKFKTIDFSANLVINDKRENVKYRFLLGKLLGTTSSKYETIHDLNMACADIYDPTYSTGCRVSGNKNILYLNASFANEKYTEKGMNEKNIQFLLNVLFEPKVVDEGFDHDIFVINRNKRIDYYKSLKDNPDAYAKAKLYEKIKVRDYDYPSIEENIKMLELLDEKELYNFYKNFIENGKLDIFITGDVDVEEIKNIIKRNVNFKNKSNNACNHIIEQKQFNEKPNIIISPAPLEQSKLLIGCKVLDMSDFERWYVFVVYSWILGGGMNSLLNQTVREKNSLCYSIYAIRNTLLGVMEIYAGIDGENFEKTLDYTLKEMKNIENGDFPLDLFEGVKNIYYNSLKSTLDNPSLVTNSYMSQIFLNTDSIDDKIKNMEKVTKEDVMKFAKKVHVDTIFLLKGEK